MSGTPRKTHFMQRNTLHSQSNFSSLACRVCVALQLLRAACRLNSTSKSRLIWLSSQHPFLSWKTYIILISIFVASELKFKAEETSWQLYYTSNWLRFLRMATPTGGQVVAPRNEGLGMFLGRSLASQWKLPAKYNQIRRATFAYT